MSAAVVSTSVIGLSGDDDQRTSDLPCELGDLLAERAGIREDQGCVEPEQNESGKVVGRVWMIATSWKPAS